MGNLREHQYDFRSVWTTAHADELRRSIKAGECYCPLANASYTNMLCHTPTLTSVALDVAKGSVTSALSSKTNGTSARLRSLPVITAADEALLSPGHTNGQSNQSNGHKTDAQVEIKV